MSDAVGKLPLGFAKTGVIADRRCPGESNPCLVLLAVDQRTERHAQVAVKMVPREDARRNQQLKKQLKREVLYMKGLLMHRHVVKFHELLLSQDSICIVMEYVPGGSLHDYVKRVGCLEESQARWFILQLMAALEYSHGMGICNRDVKLDHLLLENANEDLPLIKLIDFGTSKNTMRESAPHSCIGTLTNMPPEVLFCGGNEKYNGPSADIWLAGCCLYRMLYGEEAVVPLDPEWQNASDPNHWPENVVKTPPERIGNGQRLPKISDQCMDFLKRTLQVCPTRRITMKEMWEHPWFQDDLSAETRDYNNKLAADTEGLQRCLGNVQSDDDLVSIMEMA